MCAGIKKTGVCLTPTENFEGIIFCGKLRQEIRHASHIGADWS